MQKFLLKVYTFNLYMLPLSVHINLLSMVFVDYKFFDIGMGFVLFCFNVVQGIPLWGFL